MNKDEYIRKLHGKIDEWNREIDRLLAKMDEVDGRSRVELQEQIDNLKSRRDELKDKAARMNRAGQEALDDLKSGADLAWEAMNQAIRSATGRFLK